jgi:hypothetical protein
MSIKGKILRKGLIWHFKSASQAKHEPIQLQKRTLHYLLSSAAKTDFGRYYQFNKIRSSVDPLKTFQETVPLTDYEGIMANWWHRSLEGAPNVCWPGRPSYFALSSGTSGSPSKKIPVTEAMLSAMRRSSKFMFAHSTQWGLDDLYDHQFLILGSSTNFVREGKIIMGDISGINASRVPNWFHRFYKPGKDILQMANWEDRVQAIAERAASWDISVLAGIPSWVQMMMEKVLEYNKIDSIAEIWPNLSIYVSGGVALGPYKQRFQKMIGKEISFLDTYNTSEGNLACQTRLDNELMPLELILNNGIFFEFIPFDEQNFQAGYPKADAVVHTVADVEEGVDYAIVLSSCAGAWRYILGDTIKFVDKSRAEIKITGRIKHFLSICGEHLSVDNMNAALEKLEQHLNIEISEFTVKALRVGDHFEHHWYLGVNKDQLPLDDERIAQLLDIALCGLNDDYQTERRDNLLKAVKVRSIASSNFIEWMKKEGKYGGQAKFPRVLTDQQFEDWKAFLGEK